MNEFVDFMGERIDALYFKNFDSEFSDEYCYAEARESVMGNLTNCLLKLEKQILKLYRQEFTSGFYYEDANRNYYMLSDRYDLSEASKMKYGFLPVD